MVEIEIVNKKVAPQIRKNLLFEYYEIQSNIESNSFEYFKTKTILNVVCYLMAVNDICYLALKFHAKYIYGV
jgi:hypothetical protein